LFLFVLLLLIDSVLLLCPFNDLQTFILPL
jgi:hypothetical protein